MKKRTLVIGDIHGAFKALEQVLDRANVTKNDTLIFLGDYVDGWSDAVNTIRFLIVLQTTHKCIFIKGNHDALTLKWLKTGKYNKQWLVHGGQATIDSYAELNRTEINLHINFYKNLKKYYLDSENRLFIHAGFTSDKGVKTEYFPEQFYWDRTLWEMVLAMDKNLDINSKYYPNRLKHYKEIYIGHTALSRINKSKPHNIANVWNIDTGAAHKNPLTILDVDTKEFWQSDPAYKLYPNETGRN